MNVQLPGFGQWRFFRVAYYRPKMGRLCKGLRMRGGGDSTWRSTLSRVCLVEVVLCVVAVDDFFYQVEGDVVVLVRGFVADS